MEKCDSLYKGWHEIFYVKNAILSIKDDTRFIMARTFSENALLLYKGGIFLGKGISLYKGEVFYGKGIFLYEGWHEILIKYGCIGRGCPALPG